MQNLDECPICFEVPVENTKFPCQHSICRECFLKCLNAGKKIECPLCRFIIVEIQSSTVEDDDRRECEKEVYLAIILALVLMWSIGIYLFCLRFSQ